MSATCNKQLYIFLFITTILIFRSNYTIAQVLPFEVDNHFEIHSDPDVGIVLMPEAHCENRTSEDFGFVFKRKRIQIISDDAPPDGSCGDIFDDDILEFFPADFNNNGFVYSSLGRDTDRWSILYTQRINATGAINGANGSLYSDRIILGRGNQILQENDGLADDGVIFSPAFSGETSDIALWANDDIVLNFRTGPNQGNGQFKVTESNPTNIRFLIGTGGSIFMPALPSTLTSYPILVFNPVDGQLYYQNLSDLVSHSASNQKMKSQIHDLEKVNQNLIDKLSSLVEKIEYLEQSMKVNKSTN